MKTISYKDISKMAQVSISTVSRYYNNGYVSKKTKERIDKVVKQFEYYPNHGARLIRGRDNSIFVIIPEWPQNSVKDICNGIIQAAKIHKRKVNITYSEKGVKEYIETVRFVLSWRPNSIVLFLPEINDELIEFIKTIEDTSIVIFGYDVDDLCWVKIDETHAFYLLTHKFYNSVIDNQKMVFVNDPKLNKSTSNDRIAGFKHACNELKIQYEIVDLNSRDKVAINNFNKHTRKNNISNIVCSTHELFIALSVLGDKSLRLTDIGYQSIYDHMNSYRSKIFIDYTNIGIEIENILWVHNINKTPTSKLIKPSIIQK